MKVLTKSRFKLGLECPNKLFFTSKRLEYANQKNDDPFMKALADGGFQVEELARLQYPHGVMIEVPYGNYQQAVDLTNKALEQENVLIYEAAFLWDGLFVRTDILEKKGNQISLIEVKAKAYDSEENNFFLGLEGGLVSKWKPYLADLAFQKYVAQNARPEFCYSSWFLMPDKRSKASVNGLNQLFRIPQGDFKRSSIVTKVSNIEETGNWILAVVAMDWLIDDIINNRHILLKDNNQNPINFKESVSLLKKAYQNDNFLNWKTKHSTCKKCEFKTTPEEDNNGLKSGFKYCFKELNHWTENDFQRPNILSVWDIRSNFFFENNALFLDQVTEEDLKVKPEAGRISRTERQWIQVSKTREQDSLVFVLPKELKEELNTWKFPLHFIDFETSTVALPFHKGRRPYEQIAFQFSHHQYNENGTIEHKSQFISNKAGEFPNFIFARELYEALRFDDGTIFRYAAHENTILNSIICQLEDSDELDKDELITFLKEVTHLVENKKMIRSGSRDMVDLLKIVKDYYYNPQTNGSNSLKYVLPAILNSSIYLMGKYSKPITEIGLSSLNLPSSHIWLTEENNQIVNPYKLLPPLFEGLTDEQIELLIGDIDTIANGGQALMAYAKLQYMDLSTQERDEITLGLLKYCELDTLAMVMLYEHFRFDLIC